MSLKDFFPPVDVANSKILQSIPPENLVEIHTTVEANIKTSALKREQRQNKSNTYIKYEVDDAVYVKVGKKEQT